MMCVFKVMFYVYFQTLLSKETFITFQPSVQQKLPKQLSPLVSNLKETPCSTKGPHFVLVHGIRPV